MLVEIVERSEADREELAEMPSAMRKPSCIDRLRRQASIFCSLRELVSAMRLRTTTQSRI